MPPISATRTPTQPQPGGNDTKTLDCNVETLADRYSALWRNTRTDTPNLGEPISSRRKRGNHRRTKRLIDSLSKKAEQWPDDEDARSRLREEIKAQILLYGEDCLAWPESYRNLVFGEDFHQTTIEFTHRARAFDRQIMPDDLSQALRNVWIMNSVQMLLDLPVGISPSIFAYSMLYPYTDNYLDDPDVPVAAKKTFNRRLETRLQGATLQGVLDSRLCEVFRLVSMIEAEHPRNACPDVYRSLLAIHRAQIESLRQQRWDRRLNSDRLLALSIRKGGASVLADGYLVEPRLAAVEADFCFGYGVLLQLLDDLQDVESDREVGHATLFSIAAGARPLDELTSRLFHFMRSVVAGASRFVAGRYADRKDLILRNCTFLLVGAVSHNHRFFSRKYLARLESAWPLGFGSMRRLRKFASRRQKKTTRSLLRRGKAGSLLELLE